MIKAILFDYNGVINLEGHLKPFAHLLARKYGIEKEQIEKSFKENDGLFDRGQIKPEEFWNRFKKKLRIEDNLNFISLFDQAAKINELVFQLIKDLKKTYKVFLFSNLNASTTEYLRNKELFSKTFDQMFFSSEEKTRKPEQAFYQIVLNKVGFKRNQVLFIDDNQSFIEKARKMGLKSLRFISTDQLFKDLRLLKIISKD